jgi:hypothetical protein
VTLLKRYFGENGGKLSKSPIYQKYLKIPYVLFDKASPFDNEELKDILTQEFCNSVREKIVSEVDKVIFFVKEVSSSRSFLTRIYEFYISNNKIPETKIHEAAYGQIKKNLTIMAEENTKLVQENTDASTLQKKLQNKYESLKNGFVRYMMDQKKLINRKCAQKLLSTTTYPIQPTQVPPCALNFAEQLSLNEKWLERHNLLAKLSKDYMSLIRQKKNGIPIDLAHVNILSKKLKILKKEISDPKMVDTVFLSNQEELAIGDRLVFDLEKPYLLVLGGPKTGKSSLVNLLLGNFFFWVKMVYRG